jgi:UDP-N-acetylglucosamine/UDP-N-acetylgalactosamine 4-epimerase
MKNIDQLKAELKISPKTWLVTGVAGFIGSNILEMLLMLDQTVTGLDNFATGYGHNLDNVRKIVGDEKWARFTFHEGDIQNLDDCKSACRGVEYVLHQAALGSVPRSVEDPIATNQSNVDGFLNMAVASIEAGVKRFVYASSSAIYGDSVHLPKIEDQIGNSLSPYAASKLINEIYAGVFSRVYEFEWIGLRYFNVFGKRQDPQGAYAAVIPRWIHALLNFENPVIHGDGETSRDFCYIKDVVQANILAALSDNSKAVNKAYNVAFGDRTSLNQLLGLIKKSLTTHIPEIEGIIPEYGPFRKGDVRHSLADVGRARELLGYMPEYSIEKGISETIEWYVAEFASKATLKP